VQDALPAAVFVSPIAQREIEIANGGAGRLNGRSFVPTKVMRGSFHVGDGVPELRDRGRDARVICSLRAHILRNHQGGNAAERDAEKDTS